MPRLASLARSSVVTYSVENRPVCERPAGVHHGPPDVVSAGVADGDDAPVAVAVPFLASDLGAGDGVRELGLGDGAASDGAVGPLARLGVCSG